MEMGIVRATHFHYLKQFQHKKRHIQFHWNEFNRQIYFPSRISYTIVLDDYSIAKSSDASNQVEKSYISLAVSQTWENYIYNKSYHTNRTSEAC